MGTLGCCGKDNNLIQDPKTQITFISDIKSEKSDIGTNDDKKDNKLFCCPKKLKSNYKQIKQNFENSMKNQAEFITEKEFEEIIEKVNDYLIDIDFPKEIEETDEQNSFIPPPVKFNNGDIYKGSWNINNQRHGFGINVNPDGLIYKGLWDKDKVGNYGLFLEKTGNYVKGELKDGKLEGKGEIEIKGKYKYTGDFKNDLPNGKGTLKDYEKCFEYKGDIVNGIKEGKGTLEFIDGTKYEGDFKNDVYDGIGVLTLKDGKKYEGEFKEGKIKGKGKFIWEDGKIYEGEYDNFMKNGNGKFIWNENKYYDGQWVNNKQHGKGLIYYDGKEIEGMFRYGKIIKEK